MKFSHFELASTDGPFGEPSLVILIDGVDLIERVRVAEQDYEVEVAGKYAGPPLRVLGSKLFHGELPDGFGWLSSGNIENTVPILGCTCGTEGCWPLHVAIFVGEESVVWESFANPFRKHWRYERLGSLRFEAEQYITELESAKSRFVS